MKPIVAISIGDLNGIGIEIALRSHNKISKFCFPRYFIDKEMAEKAAYLLKIKPPRSFMKRCIEKVGDSFDIEPSKATKESGLYSFLSFKKALAFTVEKKANALVTLPVSKKGWEIAKIPYKGHTEVLRSFFKKEAIMLMGWENMFVALYTEHIPLKDVPKKIEKETLKKFL
jgi:4-hydroxythreonine-4-phosphate dehydrogenase